MIAIRLAEAGGARRPRRGSSSDIFSERYPVKRPLLQALEPDDGGAPVLLIDELDRTDEPFEAFLLEVLARFPGDDPRARHDQAPSSRRSSSSPRTARARSTTRSSAAASTTGSTIPDAERELEIVRAQGAAGARASCRARSSPSCRRSAREDLFKAPGVAETLDWAAALVALDAVALDPAHRVRHARRAAEIPGRHPGDAGR